MNLSELRLLYEELQSKGRVRDAIASIKRGTVSVEDIAETNYFTHYDRYYSEDDYVVDYYNNVIDKDNAHWCSGEEAYFHDDDCVNAYEGRLSYRYSRRYCRNNDEFYEYEGVYYDSDALERNDLVFVDNGSHIMHANDAYYDEDNDEWYSECRESYLRSYHSGSYHSLSFDGKSKYKIGYEIEKEDESVRNSIKIDRFEDMTDYIWRKERDGSLCDDAGFELISPTFEFDIDKIFEHIEGNDLLVKHINAETSFSCGGHIHLSKEGLTGDELFDQVKGYTPLFYALYHGRVDKNYCKGKKNDDLKNDGEKYQAIKIHSDRVEFRIISAVRNVEMLKWRSKLLMMIINNPTDDIIKAYYNVDTKFIKLLKQVYSDERLVELKDRFIKYTKHFENLDIIK